MPPMLPVDYRQLRDFINDAKKLIFACVGLGVRGLDEKAKTIGKVRFNVSGTVKLRFNIPFLDKFITLDTFINNEWNSEAGIYPNNPALLKIGSIRKGDILKFDLNFVPVIYTRKKIERTVTINSDYKNVYVKITPTVMDVKKVADKTYYYHVDVTVEIISEPSTIHYGLASLVFDSKYLPTPPENCNIEMDLFVYPSVRKKYEVIGDFTTKIKLKEIQKDRPISLMVGYNATVPKFRYKVPLFDEIDAFATETVKDVELTIQVYDYKCIKETVPRVKFGVLVDVSKQS